METLTEQAVDAVYNKNLPSMSKIESNDEEQPKAPSGTARRSRADRKSGCKSINSVEIQQDHSIQTSSATTSTRQQLQSQVSSTSGQMTMHHPASTTQHTSGSGQILIQSQSREVLIRQIVPSNPLVSLQSNTSSVRHLNP